MHIRQHADTKHTLLLMMMPASFARLLPCLKSLHACMGLEQMIAATKTIRATHQYVFFIEWIRSLDLAIWGERASVPPRVSLFVAYSVRKILMYPQIPSRRISRHVVLHSIYSSFIFEIRSSKKWYPCRKPRCQAKRRYVDRVVIEISPLDKLSLNAMKACCVIETCSCGQGSEGGTGLWRTSEHFRRKGKIFSHSNDEYKFWCMSITC